jgi:hypothetical protein
VVSRFFPSDLWQGEPRYTPRGEPTLRRSPTPHRRTWRDGGAVYAAQAMNEDAERQAIDIRVRAERKTGELIKEGQKTGQIHDNNGSAHRPSSKVPGDSTPSRKTLAEICLSLP